MQISYLSRDGYKKLETELEYLMKVRRKEITEAIAVARGFGDLKENAEYSAAKEAQSMNEIKIQELTLRLANARLLEGMDIPKDKVYIGATVKLRDLKTNDELFYILVSESETDIMASKISVSSPIAKGLLGKKVNDIAEIQVPAGILKYEIIEISRDDS